MGEVTQCGICAGTHLVPVLDLGRQPLAERDDGNRYPLELLECQDCTLVQLSYIVDQRAVFRPDHPYATGNTAALVTHFSELALGLMPRLQAGDLVIDIGANDGTLLSAFLDRGVNLLAVEPTGQAAKCRDKGLPVVNEFFTAELAGRIRDEYGRAKIVIAANVLAHVPDPHDFMRGVAGLLPADGIFVTENHDWASVVNGLQIDTVYHEHLRYYTPATLGLLLARHGLLTESSVPVPVHGGSFRVTAVPQEPSPGMRARAAADALLRLAEEICQSGGRIYGVGAATRATPLIHYAGLAPFITCVCEVAGSDKTGMTMPGTGIPVVDEEILVREQPGYALLFSWHIAGHLIPKLRQMGYKGKFIIPLPYPEVTDG